MNLSFVYRMKNTRASSDKFGACQVCGKHADSVYMLVQMMPYTRHNGTQGLTHHGCRGNVFGHKDCLASETER